MNTATRVSTALNTVLPIRIGFLLERSDVTCPWCPSASYRGIDRLPYIPIPEEETELRSARRNSLLDVWERYWEAKDSGKLNILPQLALDLQQGFRSEGINFEAIYAEIAELPDKLDQHPAGELWPKNLTSSLTNMRHIYGRVVKPRDDTVLLGYDLAHPVPSFHSAIYQPGLHRQCADLQSYLNRHGLFEEVEVARQFNSIANQMSYGLLPFCIVAIWEMPA